VRLFRAGGIAAQSTIYFIAPDYSMPSGGNRVLYRHVDILNSVGIRAFVVHYRPGFRLTWFANETPVTYIDSVRLSHSDVVVVSEVDVGLVERLPPATRYVIFNQSGQLFLDQKIEAVEKYYQSEKLAGVAVVSQRSSDMINFSFPQVSTTIIRLGLNEGLFHVSSGARGRRIGYMPRRGGKDVEKIVAMLSSRGILRDWQMMPIGGVRHEEVADKLRETTIFLALTQHEGFGLPAAEAMACGNYVIGNHGYGGEEFFSREFCAPVSCCDLLGFAKALEEAVTNERSDEGWCERRGKLASSFVLSRYSLSNEVNDVVSFYSRILAERGGDKGR
jgi:hypothetical protein